MLDLILRPSSSSSSIKHSNKLAEKEENIPPPLLLLVLLKYKITVLWLNNKFSQDSKCETLFVLRHLQEEKVAERKKNCSLLRIWKLFFAGDIYFAFGNGRLIKSLNCCGQNGMESE